MHDDHTHKQPEATRSVELLYPGSYSQEQLLHIARGIEQVRRKGWLSTYPNSEADISREDIEGSFLPFDEQAEALAKRINDSEGVIAVWIARDGDAIIGFCSAYKGEKSGIAALYVLQEYQGQGIGKELLLAALAWHRDTPEVVLEVATYNDSALGFYTKLGFEEIGRSKYPLRLLQPPKSIPTVKMVKRMNQGD